MPLQLLLQLQLQLTAVAVDLSCVLLALLDMQQSLEDSGQPARAAARAPAPARNIGLRKSGRSVLRAPWRESELLDALRSRGITLAQASRDGNCAQRAAPAALLSG